MAISIVKLYSTDAIQRNELNCIEICVLAFHTRNVSLNHPSGVIYFPARLVVHDRQLHGSHRRRAQGRNIRNIKVFVNTDHQNVRVRTKGWQE